MARDAPSRLSRAATIAATALVIAAGAAAYVSLFRAQRSLFLNGSTDGSYPRSGADLTAAADSLASYWLFTGLVIGAYVIVLVLVRVARTPWAAGVAIAAGVVGQLSLVLVRPTLSIDLYSYVAHGYFANRPGDSPYTTPAAAAIGSPLGSELLSAGWTPVHPQTPYGPLWTDIESLAVSLADGSVATAALLIKVVVVLASIGTGVMAYLVAQRVRPGSGPLAATAWLLNPVAVSEFAGDGHNDAVAIFFVALAVWAAVRGWGLVAFPALALGALVKYTPAVFALALLVLLLRQAGSRSRAALGAIGGVLIGAVVAVLVWLPWWEGWDTLMGLRASTTPLESWSPAGWLAAMFNDPYAQVPNMTPQLVLAGALVAVVLAASWGGTPRRTLIGCAVIAVAVLAVSPSYWPWYSALAVAMLVMRPSGPSLVAAVVLSLGSRIAGPFGDVPQVGLMQFPDAFTIASLAGLTLPVAACVLVGLVGLVVSLVSGRRRRRAAVLDAGETPPDGGSAEAAEA